MPGYTYCDANQERTSNPSESFGYEIACLKRESNSRLTENEILYFQYRTRKLIE